MLTRKAIRFLLAWLFALTWVPSLDFGPAKASQAPAKGPIIQVRARDGGFLPQEVLEQVRKVPHVAQAESFLAGKTSDGVRVIGVEPTPMLQLRSDSEVRAAAIIQGRSDSQRRRGQAEAPPSYLIGGHVPHLFSGLYGRTAYPSSSEVFGVSSQTIGFIVPAYMLPYGVSMLFYGLLSDRLGRRRIMLASLLAFVVLTARASESLQE